MVKKLIINFFKKLGFSVKITKLRVTEKYRINSDKDGLNLYDTPTGKYYLPANLKYDDVSNTIKKGHYFDEAIINVAKKYYRKDTSILEIGANYGQMSVVLSKYLAERGNGKVYSFEAEPYVAEILKSNIAINNCNNVKIIQGAVFYRSGEKVIFPEPDFIKFPSYGSYGIDPQASSGREIETLTIDSLFIKEPVSFIKIDIQGSDLFALQGARETILKNKPAIIFEYEEQFQEQFKTSFNDYVEFVRSLNYRFVSTFMDINYLIMPCG